jgi:hypothetical protein
MKNLIIGQITVGPDTRSFITHLDLMHSCYNLSTSDSFKDLVAKELSSFANDPYSNGRALFGGKETFKLIKAKDIMPEAFEQFILTYKTALTALHTDETHNHDLYNTYHRMVMAFAEGTYNKDSDAIKSVCKFLKIKHTYKAINAYLAGE